MKTAEYMDWQSRLHELTDDQAQDVVRRMTRLNKKFSATPTELPAVNEDWLLDGILAALQRHHLLSRGSVYKVQKSHWYKEEYQRDAPAIRKRLRELIPKHTRQYNAKRTLAFIVGGCLIRWVQKHEHPNRVNANFIVGQVCRSIEALEEQFPGYIKAGLMPIVILGGRNAKDLRSDKRASTPRARRAPRE